jgi:asparaginyl-tRNA synthetase
MKRRWADMKSAPAKSGDHKYCGRISHLKERTGIDFFMETVTLWLRSQRQWAIMRIRNCMIYSIHRFFQEEGFMQADAPIFTGNAVEGTSHSLKLIFTDGPPTCLNQDSYMEKRWRWRLGKIYTFGPTFRAEKSKRAATFRVLDD